MSNFELNKILGSVEAGLSDAGQPDPTTPPQRASAAIARHRTALTDEAGLRRELTSLGYSGERMERLVRSAVLDRATTYANLRADVAIAEFRAGHLTVGLLKGRLIEAGFAEDIAGLTARRYAAQPEAPSQEFTTVGLVLDIGSAAVKTTGSPERVSVGLVLETEPQSFISEPTREAVSVGISIEADSQDIFPLTDTEPVSTGLTLLISPSDLVQESLREDVATGLDLEILASDFIPDPAREPVTVGLKLQVPPRFRVDN